MGCCDDTPIDDVYVPLHKRLVDYGKDSCDNQLLSRYSYTRLWVFSFYDDENLCIDCETKFSSMIQWFNKYGLLEDVIKNVKWIVDDDIDNNLLLKDMGIKKTPVHLFCDTDGKIIDIIFGFPSQKWLEKYILPVVRSDNPDIPWIPLCGQEKLHSLVKR